MHHLGVHTAGIMASKQIRIVSANVGCVAQHYDGRRSIVFRSRWKAQLCAEIFGAGWFVRELVEPLFVVDANAEKPAALR